MAVSWEEAMRNGLVLIIGVIVAIVIVMGFVSGGSGQKWRVWRHLGVRGDMRLNDYICQWSNSGVHCGASRCASINRRTGEEW